MEKVGNKVKKKILAFGASSSKNSINKKFATYTAGKLATKFSADLEVIDLNDFEVSIFSVDKEAAGTPEKILQFARAIDQSDLIVISMAEHNGAYTAAFKNIFDWTSRIKDRKTFAEKKVLILATSGGSRGGASVLEIAKNRFPHSGAQVVGTFSLPLYYENFSESEGVKNPTFKEQFDKVLNNITF